MQLIYNQLVGCIITAICSITFGILLKKPRSKSFTVAITVIVHMVILCAYGPPLFYILFRGNFIHYDVILGIPLLGFQTGLRIIGTIIIFFGIFFCLISLFTLAISGKGLPAIILSEKLTAKGIYAFTRNPMSLGFYLALVSFGFLRGSLFFILWSLIVIIPTHICFLKFFEERELESRFGQPYIEYKKRVPFLIPNLRNIFITEKSSHDKHLHINKPLRGYQLFREEWLLCLHPRQI